MSTRAFSSTIANVPIEKAWTALRDFGFPSRFFSFIESCEIEDNLPPTTVGAHRTIRWATGDYRTQRLLALDDQYHKVVWELVLAEPPVEVQAIITTVRLYRVSSNNSTLITWESDFSAEVTADFVLYEQRAYAANLDDIKRHLEAGN